MHSTFAAVLSHERVAGQTHSWRGIWGNPDIRVIIAFSLVAALVSLATLFLAAHYPLVFENLYEVL